MPHLTRLILTWVVASATLISGTNASAQTSPKIPDDVEFFRDVEFGTGGGRPLRLHLARPKLPHDAPLPVVVWIHGGGWTGGSRDGGIGHCVMWARRGYVGVAIEYRFSGEAKFPAQIEDCKCAIRFLRAKAKDYHLDPDRIGVAGHSAGGHLAAILGTSSAIKQLEGTGGWADFSSRVQAVCDASGPADFVTWGDKAHPAVKGLLGGLVSEKPELAALASPVTHASKSSSPFLIIHGDEDDVVPVAEGKAMHAALQKAGADSTLLILPGVKHHPYGTEMSTAMEQFFDRHLKKKPSSP
jgi:acetyl esterase/lipase